MANCERHNQMVSIIYWHHCGEEINMSLSMLTQVQLNKGPWLIPFLTQIREIFWVEYDSSQTWNKVIRDSWPYNSKNIPVKKNEVVAN